MLIPCTECGQQLSHTATRCPKCGAPGPAAPAAADRMAEAGLAMMKAGGSLMGLGCGLVLLIIGALCLFLVFGTLLTK